MANLYVDFDLPETVSTGIFDINLTFRNLDRGGEAVNLLEVLSNPVTVRLNGTILTTNVSSPEIISGTSTIAMTITGLAEGTTGNIVVTVNANTISWTELGSTDFSPSSRERGPSDTSSSDPIPINIPRSTPEPEEPIRPEPQEGAGIPTTIAEPTPAPTIPTGPEQPQNIVSIPVKGIAKTATVTITPPPGRILKKSVSYIRFNWSEPVGNSFTLSDINLVILDTFKVIYQRSSSPPLKPRNGTGTRNPDDPLIYTPPNNWSLELPSGTNTLYASVVRLRYDASANIEYSDIIALTSKANEPEAAFKIQPIYRLSADQPEQLEEPGRNRKGNWNSKIYLPPSGWATDLPSPLNNDDYLYVNIAILGQGEGSGATSANISYIPSSLKGANLFYRKIVYKAKKEKKQPNELNSPLVSKLVIPSDPNPSEGLAPSLSDWQSSRDSTTFSATLTAPETTDYFSGTIGVIVKKESALAQSIGGRVPVKNVSITFPYNRLEDPERTIVNPPTTAERIVNECNRGDTSFNSSSNPFLGSDGGAFRGISDLLLFEFEDTSTTPSTSAKYLYGVLQIQNTIGRSAILGDSYRAILFELNLNTCNPKIIKSYTSSGLLTTGRSLVIDYEVASNKKLYWFEGSHYLYQVTGLDQSIRHKTGHVFSVSIPFQSADDIVDHGLNWRSGDVNDIKQNEAYYGKHEGTASPMVVEDSTLYLSSGFSILRTVDPETTDTNTSDVTRTDNWLWLQYKKQLNQRVPILLTNNKKGFNVIKELASLTNCFIGFDKGTFFYKTRKLHIGTFRSSLNASPSSLELEYTNDNPNREFPESGYLLLYKENTTDLGPGITDLEVVSYNAAKNTEGEDQFTLIKRGLSGTKVIYHNVPVETPRKIIYLNHILTLNQSTLQKPINEFNIRSDSTQLYNQIRITYGENQDLEYYIEDLDSVEENGGNEFEIQLPLDRHQRRWVEHLANDYLQRYKNMQYLIELHLKPTFYMSLGDVVYLDQKERSYLQRACQVYRIRQNPEEQTTSITLRTL